MILMMLFVCGWAIRLLVIRLGKRDWSTRLYQMDIPFHELM